MAGVRVECNAGYRGEETPRRFHLEGRTIEITEILDRWTEPDARLFRIRGDDGRVYVPSQGRAGGALGGPGGRGLSRKGGRSSF